MYIKGAHTRPARNCLSPDRECRTGGENGGNGHDKRSPVSLEAVDWIDAEFGFHFGDADMLRLLFTPRKANPTENYERLEFLGDSVLSLALTNILFDLNPCVGIGQLLARRKRLSSNESLKQIASTKGIPAEIESLGSGTVTDVSTVSQEIVEAIFGGIFRIGGYEIAEGAVAQFFGPKAFCLEESASEHFSEYFEARSRQETYRNGNWKVDRESLKVNDKVLQGLCDALKLKPKYRFLDPDIFFWASAPYVKSSAPAYARLVRLGRMALNLSVGDALLTLGPTDQESQLHEQRQEIMSKESLADKAWDLGLHTFLQNPSKERVAARYQGAFPKKFLANHLKAFAGAIFVDSGFDAVREFSQAVELI